MNQLIDDAIADVDLAVSDIEEALKEQRSEWTRSIESFEEVWYQPANLSTMQVAPLGRGPHG